MISLMLTGKIICKSDREIHLWSDKDSKCMNALVDISSQLMTHAYEWGHNLKSDAVAPKHTGQ